MSTSTRALQAGFLYAVLTYRGDLAAWHWAFFVPNPAATPIGTRGTLFHVEDEDPDPAHDRKLEMDDKDVVGSPLTVACIELTHVDFGSYEDVIGDQGLLSMLRTVPIPPADTAGARDRPLFSCRTWFLEGVQVLNDCGVVTCDDVGLLEREIRRNAFTAMGEYLQDRGWSVFRAEHCT